MVPSASWTGITGEVEGFGVFDDVILSLDGSGELFWGTTAAGSGEVLGLREILCLTVVWGWAEDSDGGGEAAGAASFWLVEVTCSSCSLRSLFSRMISSNVFTLTVSPEGSLFPFVYKLNGGNDI